MAGIPAVQIAHTSYQDLLVRHGITGCITTANELKKITKFMEQSMINRSLIYEKLGFRRRSMDILEKTLFPK